MKSCLMISLFFNLITSYGFAQSGYVLNYGNVQMIQNKGVSIDCLGSKILIKEYSKKNNQVKPVSFSLKEKQVVALAKKGCEEFKTNGGAIDFQFHSKSYFVADVGNDKFKEETTGSGGDTSTTGGTTTGVVLTTNGEGGTTNGNTTGATPNVESYFTDNDGEVVERQSRETNDFNKDHEEARKNLNIKRDAAEENKKLIANNTNQINENLRKISNLEREKKALSKGDPKIEEINSTIDGLKNFNDNASQKNDELKREVDRLTKQSNKTESEIKQKEDKMNAAHEGEKQLIVSEQTEKLQADYENCLNDKTKSTEECDKLFQKFDTDMKAQGYEGVFGNDSNPEKSYDPTFFAAYPGKEIFPQGYCSNAWERIDGDKEVLRKFLYEQASGGTDAYSCSRYTKDINTFYSTKRTLTETAAMLESPILCTDVIRQDDECGKNLSLYLSCDKIDSNVIKNKKSVSELCPKYKDVKISDVENSYGSVDSDLVQACQEECNTNFVKKISACYEKVGTTALSQQTEHCFAYKSVATINFEDGNSIDHSDIEYASFDGKYTCQRRSPFTADYRYCKKLVVAYNAAFAAEQGMNMAEGIQRSVGEANAMGAYVEGQVSGNGQIAGLNSVQAIAKTNEDIETQKAALYTAQFGVFAGMMLSWPTQNNIVKTCKKSDVEYPQECSNAIHFAGRDAQEVLFPNYGVKQRFYEELIKAAGNSAVAWIKKNMYDKQQKLIDGVKNDVFTPEDSGGFVYSPTYCEQYPTSTQCRGSGNRVSVDGISGGGLNLVGGGAQDYSFSNDDLGEYNEGRDITSNAEKANISSMLNDNVEKGGSDFNKVAAAKVSASGASGGGSPGAGGGSASLVGGGSGGEGASGAAKDGFGVTKSNAKYAAASGSAGYSGSKARQFGKDKKVDNPFSSLFGAKKNSRDVASNTENDIAPAQSSLFKKISNRYMEVKNQKRLLDSQVK